MYYRRKYGSRYRRFTRRKRFTRYRRRRNRRSSIYAVAKRACVKVLNKRVERKNRFQTCGDINLFQDVPIGSLPLYDIDKGDSSFQRNGSQVFVKWMVLKGFFTIKTNPQTSVPPVRQAAIRIMLIKTAQILGAVSPATSFTNTAVLPIESELFLEPATGIVRKPYIDNFIDRRQTRWIVLFDKTYEASSTYGLKWSETGQEISAFTRRFRCAVRLNKRVKYDDISTVPPFRNDGYTYLWYIVPWSPLRASDSEIGLISACSNVYYTDS